MKLCSHPGFHECPTPTLRQLKALSHISFGPMRNATDHRFSSVAGCATGSTRPSSAHNRSGLQSLYFGLFLYQVHRVATVAGVSRRLACVELRRIHLPRLSEKGKRSLPCSLTEHQNGTFRPIFASQHVQIRAQSVVRTPFRTVSPLDFSHLRAEGVGTPLTQPLRERGS